MIEAQSQICVNLRPSAVRSSRGASLRSFAAIPDLRISGESKLIPTDPLYLLSAICYLL